jgi:ABC-2 type transport system ATP-binding protein
VRTIADLSQLFLREQLCHLALPRSRLTLAVSPLDRGGAVAAISIRSLTKRFGSTLAVDDLTFDVAPGTVTGFVGPNGAGKTTTLRTLVGLVSPTSGSATIHGSAYRDLPDPARVVGAVLERSGFHPGRSGRNHLRVLTRAASLPEARADEVLELVGLAEFARRRVGAYSLGMRQRLALAGALLGDPDVLVLDEPANGLDPEGIRWIRNFLRAQGAEGRAVLVSSHVLAEVAQTVDEVVVIDGGRLVAQGRVEDLTQRVAASVRVRTPDAHRFAEILRANGTAVDLVEPDRLVAHDSTGEAVGTLAAERGVTLYELVTEAPTLEEAFLELTRGKDGEP